MRIEAVLALQFLVLRVFLGGQAPDASCIAGFLYQGSFFEGVKSFASCGMRSRDCENLEPSSQ